MSLGERMTEAEVQLRAARRIMLTNERHLNTILAQSRRLDSAQRARQHADCARLQQRICDAEAAARAAGEQLRQIEEELFSVRPNVESERPSTPRLASQPSTPRSPYERTSRYERSPYESVARGRPHSARNASRPLPPMRGQQLDRQYRAAEQVVRAQLRLATRQTPVIVRPSRR